MTIYRIQAPNAQQPVIMLGSSDPGQHVYLLPDSTIGGNVGYTTNAGVANYCQNPTTASSYVVTTVGSIPALYTTECARLDAHGTMLVGGPIHDGDDSTSSDRWPTLGGDNTGSGAAVIAGTQ